MLSASQISILTNKKLSDAEKVTILLSQNVQYGDISALAKARDLPEELVKRHISKFSGKEDSLESPSLQGLILVYQSAYRARFKVFPAFHNTRACIRAVAKKHGSERTAKIIEAWIAGTQTPEQAKIFNLYKEFGTKNKK